MSTFVRSLTVEIHNASDIEIVVSGCLLTGGEWATAPIPGAPIFATQAYGNGASDAQSLLGGQIALMLASGGSITSAWNWPSGSPVSGSVSTAATNLAVTHQISNTQTNNPTMQIVIANASSIARIV
ncbi:hypothetical protein [Pseudomonas frederiksbergensis]|uniref:Uncharacterized protein n=1 Tax=Pseudomonas frederiksbergensis TaxID=104087 RepID=A0A6L5BUM2_9PSED|nr:hypothetical protein [Pseudomonas frederiksbergensis]KAF2391735.1 hypothetical protein FX983_06220 [Pseudomonas frederiksbergensis]